MGKIEINTENNPFLKSIEIERQVICISVYNKAMCGILIDMNDSDFLDQDLVKIKTIISRMFAENSVISPTSVYNEITDGSLKKKFAEIASEQFFGEPETIYRQFQKFHRIVQLQPHIEELMTMAIDGHPNFDEKFEELALMYSSSKVAQEATEMRELFRQKPEDIKEKYFRVKTTIPSLDNKIKWLYGGQYITIAGAPGSGKSTLAILIAERIPDSLVMSYEMSAEEIHDIMVSRKTGIDSNKMEDGLLDFEERRIIEAARRELADTCSLRVCDQGLNMSDMLAFIKFHVQKYGVKVVVIDYAQIVPGIPGKGSQTEKFENLSRRLKLLARELKIVVIALSQLNKDSIREGRAPNLSDLRGSLSFGADADKVIFLYSIPDEEHEGEGETHCAVGKNRKGQTGKVEGFRYIKNIHFIG